MKTVFSKHVNGSPEEIRTPDQKRGNVELWSAPEKAPKVLIEAFATDYSSISICGMASIVAFLMAFLLAF